MSGRFDELIRFIPTIEDKDFGKWIVDRDKLHGKSKNTPFKGMKMKGKVVKTILEGKVVFEED